MRTTSSILIATVLLLIATGVVMLASASSVRASASFDDSKYFVVRQMVWVLIACVAGVLVSKVDYHRWNPLAPWLLLVSVILLILVFVPGIGLKVGGSHRWLRLGPMTFQPSEMAKFAAVVAMAAWMARIGRRAREWWMGVLYPLGALGIVLVLLLLEPDFGTLILTATVGFLILFAGGARPGHLLITGTLGFCMFIVAVMRDPVRLGRILAFAMPEKYPDKAYHLMQSKTAFVIGGWTGVGLGNSLQKHLYLPEAHTDFILAIIGEELGLFATLAIVALFLGILVCGFLIMFRAPDPFGRLLAFGLTMLITVQAGINIGVVTGCLPTKGLALPFISYGGSSLVASVACIGVLLNIARHADGGDLEGHSRPIKDRVHRLG